LILAFLENIHVLPLKKKKTS